MEAHQRSDRQPGDGKSVVVVGSNEEYREPSNFSSAGNVAIGTYQALGLLHAMDASGREAPGWPKFTGGWIIATPAVGRLGARPVVAVTTREGKLWVWRARGDPDARFWPQARHDATNAGVLVR